MHAPSHKLLLLLPAVFLAGCFPTHWTDAPGVAGQVVSRATNRPVVGASVSMTAGSKSVQARTDQSGSFSLPAIKHWELLWLLEVGYISNGTLRVQAAGYRPVTTQEGELPDIQRTKSDPGVTHYPSGHADSERVRVVLTPGA